MNSPQRLLAERPSVAQHPLESLILAILATGPSVPSTANPAQDCLDACAQCVDPSHAGYVLFARALNGSLDRYKRS